MPLNTGGIHSVFAISDLHADFKPNMQWVKDIPSARCGAAGNGSTDGMSVLLVAGDVASDLDTLKEGLLALKGKFDEVVFVPGNHELWCQRGGLNLSLSLALSPWLSLYFLYIMFIGILYSLLVHTFCSNSTRAYGGDRGSMQAADGKTPRIPWSSSRTCWTCASSVGCTQNR